MLYPKYNKIPLSSLINPMDGGICCVGYWWFVTSDRCILRYSDYSFQCNKNKKILESCPIEDCSIEFFDVLYIPWKESGYILQ